MSELVRRDTLKNQLAGVRVLTQVALEGDVDAEPNGCDDQQDRGDREMSRTLPDPLGNRVYAISNHIQAASVDQK